jgi:hypothetical protein
LSGFSFEGEEGGGLIFLIIALEPTGSSLNVFLGSLVGGAFPLHPVCVFYFLHSICFI